MRQSVANERLLTLLRNCVLEIDFIILKTSSAQREYICRSFRCAAFHVQCCLEPFGQHCTGFLLVQCVLGVLRCTGYFAAQCCSSSIKITLHTFFFQRNVVCSLRQHCTGFQPVYCCPSSIKTTLNKIFTCANV